MDMSSIKVVNSHFTVQLFFPVTEKSALLVYHILMNIVGMLSVTDKALPANKVCGLYDLP